MTSCLQKLILLTQKFHITLYWKNYTRKFVVFFQKVKKKIKMCKIKPQKWSSLILHVGNLTIFHSKNSWQIDSLDTKIFSSFYNKILVWYWPSKMDNILKVCYLIFFLKNVIHEFEKRVYILYLIRVSVFLINAVCDFSPLQEKSCFKISERMRELYHDWSNVQ